MRNTILTVAALLASTQALKINTNTIQERASEVTKECIEKCKDAAGDPNGAPTHVENSWCTGIDVDLGSLQNDLYKDKFETNIVWYDGMKDFWQRFNASSAFYWFDCAHGNGDGQVNVDEFSAGLQDGYADAPHCYKDKHWDWVEQARVEEIKCTTTWYQNQEWRRSWELYAKLTGTQVDGATNENTVDSASYVQWMNRATTQGISIIDAQTVWNYAAKAGYFNPDQDITKNQYQTAAWKNIEGQTQYFLLQKIVFNDEILEPMWYFTQGCSDPLSYWYALVQDPDTQPSESKESLDYNRWMDTICSNWELCEDKL